MNTDPQIASKGNEYYDEVLSVIQGIRTELSETNEIRKKDSPSSGYDESEYQRSQERLTRLEARVNNMKKEFNETVLHADPPYTQASLEHIAESLHTVYEELEMWFGM